MRVVTQKQALPDRLYAPFWIATTADDLQGPSSGFIVLPKRLAWNVRDCRFDLADRGQVVAAYSRVLSSGTAADIRRWIDMELLAAVLDDLRIPRIARREWGQVLRELLDSHPELSSE